MADEITTKVQVTCAHGDWSFSRTVNKTSTQATAGQYTNAQAVGTTHEALALPADISAKGIVLLVNQGPTNYAEIGVDVSGTFYPLGMLPLGVPTLFYMASGATPYVKANAAGIVLDVSILSA